MNAQPQQYDPPAGPTLVNGGAEKSGHDRQHMYEGRANRRATVAFLLLAGLMLLGIGGAILLVPHAFHGGNGILLGDDPNLLSETRAPGGLLVGSAVLILTGTVRREMRSLAVVLTALVYGCFGLGRLVSLTLDGMPSVGIAGATVIELIVGATALAILIRRDRTASEPHVT